MGKASTWIKNFLLGKKEDKYKKLDSPTLSETRYLNTPSASLQPATPKVKRRWSFRRTSSTKVTTHKINRSFDSIYMPRQEFLEHYIQQKALPIMINVHAAATRIQAAYRSYLARRALRALKALVKIQALARGHLVRKHTNAVMRSMHAILAIQVRARINRAQVAEEVSAKLEDVSSERIQKMRGALRSRSVRYDHTLSERAEYGHTRQYSGRLSFSQRECTSKMPPSPSTSSFTDSSSATYDGQLEEVSYRMEQRNSKRHYAWPESKQASVNPIMRCSDHATSSSELAPNYMTKTQSSKAKARSESEPRQRPKIGRKQKSRRTSSMDGKNDKDQYSWMIKLYRSGNFMNDGDSNSSMMSALTRTSFQKKLMPFEPPVSLY